ncbi:MAG: MFS transporter [Alphaproteobacteria bacterium]|nr:MFS transporter [Alphaproteobacteria bacterium]
MTELIVALAAFVGTHFLLSHPLRPLLAGKLGEPAFAGVYSLVALATFGWAAMAFRAAPVEQLWVAGPGVWHAASLVMLLASILFAGSILSPNPSLPMAGALAKSGPQGVMRITRHPMMWSFALWAAVHAAVAGTSRTLALTVAVGLLALVGSKLQDGKKAQQLGDKWAAFAAETSWLPFGRGLALPGWRATIGGLVIFLAATWLHPLLGAPVVGIWEWL